MRNLCLYCYVLIVFAVTYMPEGAGVSSLILYYIYVIFFITHVTITNCSLTYFQISFPLKMYVPFLIGLY